MAWTTNNVGELRAAQNYATNHVLLQPTGAPLDDPAQMAPVVKLFPFGAWPAGEPGTPSGLPSQDGSLIYYIGGV